MSKQSSSGDFSRRHPYLKGIKKEDCETAKIVRSHKSSPALWVEVIQNGVVTFSNRPRMKLPKEKAKELVEKFIPLNECHCLHNLEILRKAKSCAVTTVDEILSIPSTKYMILSVDTLRYWQEVKSEIEKV